MFCSRCFVSLIIRVLIPEPRYLGNGGTYVRYVHIPQAGKAGKHCLLTLVLNSRSLHSHTALATSNDSITAVWKVLYASAMHSTLATSYIYIVYVHTLPKIQVLMSLLQLQVKVYFSSLATTIVPGLGINLEVQLQPPSQVPLYQPMPVVDRSSSLVVVLTPPSAKLLHIYTGTTPTRFSIHPIPNPSFIIPNLSPTSSIISKNQHNIPVVVDIYIKLSRFLSLSLNPLIINIYPRFIIPYFLILVFHT